MENLRIPSALVDLVERGLDVAHEVLLERISCHRPELLRESLRALDSYVVALTEPYRWLRMERVARIEADIYRQLADFPEVFGRYRLAESPLDNSEIRVLKSKIVPLITGGLITGAGGGGFALLVARKGRGEELRARLNALREQAEYAKSGVVEYRMNARGITLETA